MDDIVSRRINLIWVKNVEPHYNNKLFLCYSVDMRSCEFIVGRLRHFFIRLAAVSVQFSVISVFWREGFEDSLRTISVATCSQGWPSIFCEDLNYRSRQVQPRLTHKFCDDLYYGNRQVQSRLTHFFVKIFSMVAARCSQGWPTICLWRFMLWQPPSVVKVDPPFICEE